MGSWRWKQWLGACVVIAALVTFWRVVVIAVIGTLGSDWNGSRLAPSFALVYGYRLYYPADEGPILNNVYGPVAALAFLPVTILRTPTPAILAGGVLQDLFVFAPLLVFVWRACVREVVDRPLALACGLGACLLLTRYPGTAYWFSMVHADGPSLALGLIACTALVSRGGAPTTRALWMSATAAVLAAWAKQTAAPLPLALACALWLGYGHKVAVRYVAMLAVTGLTASAIFLLWCGRPMLFNMVELVSRHAWYRPGVAGLAATVWALLVSIRDLLVLCGAALALSFFVRPTESPLRERPWVAPLLAAVLLLPAGALGANKIGGEPSSFHSVYYLIAGVAALFADLGHRAPATRSVAWAFCILAVLAAWQSGRCVPRPTQMGVWHNNHQRAYETALRHPGEVYFPWQPLASLLAEGQLYHFEYGMLDRYIAGFEPSPPHFQAHLPPRLRWVAAHARIWTLNHFFADYADTSLPELPGWIVRTRAESAAGDH
jgi:hypothetical protein